MFITANARIYHIILNINRFSYQAPTTIFRG